MASSSVNLQLKLLIDRKNQRVLFAEAGKDFIDFLFSLLALPVGTVIRLLDNKNIEGGLAKLYKSISDLNDDYIQSDQKKDVLLKPKSSLPFSSPKLPMLSTEEFSISSPSPAPNSSAVFYKCSHCDILFTSSWNCPTYCSCGHMMYTTAGAKGGGFVKGLVTYMVMDDLAVSPMLSTISNFTLLKDFNIKDFDAVEEKVVDIGMDEGLELLRHSLNSKTVLTDALLSKVTVKDDNL